MHHYFLDMFAHTHKLNAVKLKGGKREIAHVAQ